MSTTVHHSGPWPSSVQLTPGKHSRVPSLFGIYVYHQRCIQNLPVQMIVSELVATAFQTGVVLMAVRDLSSHVRAPKGGVYPTG